MSNLNDLEIRIENIERQIANGLRGSRGPAGDIVAATAAAEKIVREGGDSFREQVNDRLADAFKRIDLYAGREHAACEASIEQFRASTYAVAEAAAVKTITETVLKDAVYQLVFECLADFGIVNPQTGTPFTQGEDDAPAF